MAKKVYVGVGDIAKKVKKMYVGTENEGTARKVKKGYIGVDGIAQCFWLTGVPEKGGSVDCTTNGYKYVAATATEDYAIFAGGYAVSSSTGRNGTANVTAYNSSVTATTCTVLPHRAYAMAAGTVGGSAIFAGGAYEEENWDGESYNTSLWDEVYAYSNSLTQSTLDPLYMYQTKAAGAAANAGSNYLLFAGGVNSTGVSSEGSNNGANSSTYTTAYDSSFTRSKPTNLNYSSHLLAGVNIGTNAVFAGGKNTDDGILEDIWYLSRVEYYNSSLTLNTSSNSLPNGVAAIAGVSMGDYAIFAGGYNGSWVNTVTKFDSSFTRTSWPTLSVGASGKIGTRLGKYTIFGAGRTDSSSYTNVVECFDNSGTKTTLPDLSVSMYMGAATSLNNDSLAFFVGGQKLDYYKIED